MPSLAARCVKAVVLARGLGTRMRRGVPDLRVTAVQASMADRGVKAMIAMADGRPFLDYILSGLADAGIAQVGLVIGPEHDLVRERYTTDLVPRRVAVSFLTQSDPRGTADAVLAAEPFADGDSFLVVNGDNLYPLTALRALLALSGPGLVGYHRESLVAKSNIGPERIGHFALVWKDRAGYLERIVEKPTPDQAIDGDLVSMNSWRFGPAIFTACRAIRPSIRGEFELQDAVTYAIANLGERFRVVESTDGVLDLSSRADIDVVARRLAGLPVSL
ncbi:MAG: sugar phosphate nucleotidyltransferase [Gemmatimonadales bacterium]